MRRAGWLLMAGVIGAVATLCVGAVTTVPAPGSTEIAQLRNEVAALRQRVASLEEQLKNGSVLVVPKDGKNHPDVINPWPDSRRVPPYWQKFEYNGMPCYIIPIHQTGAPARETKNQIPPDKAPAAPTDSTPKP